MKKILIIADGILAKHFLQRVMDTDASDNLYEVISYNDATLPDKKAENFSFFSFDPTSFEKLSPFLYRDYVQVMIVVAEKLDATASYENIRKIKKDIQIMIMDKWNLEYDDTKLMLLKTKNILSSRFADYLPNVPVIAQNVGLGTGEIMEIRVPIGSSYVYRHIASIQQNRWKISAVYRANKLILPRPTLMIQPNDMLLAVGDPVVLQSVYRSIKREIGQFPSPFGNSIYCLVDMKNMHIKTIEKIVDDALLLHAKINSIKLYIKIINPTICTTLDKIKGYDSKYIDVSIDYFKHSAIDVMREDLHDSDVGLLVVSNDFFIKHTKSLFDIHIPVFKIGAWGFANIKESVVLSSDSEDIERESSVVFDLSSQLDLGIKLYNFNPNGLNERNSLVEHFINLSKLFGKEIDIISENKNPLLILQNRNDILQFVPFNKKILSPNLLSIFSTDMERLYFKLSNCYQLFIPTAL
ncbi:MAG: potassium transporter TrkA [Sulfurospirillum sp.]|nr:potassium transporter TrkA [Sulfurospirillum sp.]